MISFIRSHTKPAAGLDGFGSGGGVFGGRTMDNKQAHDYEYFFDRMLQRQ